MSILTSIFSIFSNKKNLNIIYDGSMDEEKNLYDYLYSNLILDDFSQLAKNNVLNINYENYCYNELDFYSIMKIITNKIIENIQEGTRVLAISCGAGQLPIMLKQYYNFNVVYGVETTFELFNLSREILKKYREYDVTRNTKVTLTMNDPLLIDFSKFNLIFVEYNNTSILYNGMLKEKIKQECQSNTIVVKFATRFKADEKIKLIDKIYINDKNKNKICVYFYRIK